MRGLHYVISYIGSQSRGEGEHLMTRYLRRFGNGMAALAMRSSSCAIRLVFQRSRCTCHVPSPNVMKGTVISTSLPRPNLDRLACAANNGVEVEYGPAAMDGLTRRGIAERLEGMGVGERAGWRCSCLEMMLEGRRHDDRDAKGFDTKGIFLIAREMRLSQSHYHHFVG